MYNYITFVFALGARSGKNVSFSNKTTNKVPSPKKKILTCFANQWTGFYMIGTSGMKELIWLSNFRKWIKRCIFSHYNTQLNIDIINLIFLPDVISTPWNFCDCIDSSLHWRCSMKKVLSKISQNPLENTNVKDCFL